jgi:hypothetical protein
LSDIFVGPIIGAVQGNAEVLRRKIVERLDLIKQCVRSDGFIAGWFEAGILTGRDSDILNNSTLAALGAPIPTGAFLSSAMVGSVGGTFVTLYVRPVELGCFFPEIYLGVPSSGSSLVRASSRAEFGDRLSRWIADFERIVSMPLFNNALHGLVDPSRGHEPTADEVQRTLGPDAMRGRIATVLQSRGEMSSYVEIRAGLTLIRYPSPFCFRLTGKSAPMITRSNLPRPGFTPGFFYPQDVVPQLSIDFGWQD